MCNHEIDWTDGDVPVSRHYGDTFYSKADGLAESRYVFLEGNDLPGRFAPGFHIAELGFGTGLNALAAWAAWGASGQAGPLRFTSFEAHPIDADDMARALALWPEIGERADALVSAWREGARRMVLGSLELVVVEGLAEVLLPGWDGKADAWFLDGFSPEKNPALWSPGLLAEVARHTSPVGTCATYSAAGHVRRSLEAAGFAVERRAGFGTKRHMSVGRL